MSEIYSFLDIRLNVECPRTCLGAYCLVATCVKHLSSISSRSLSMKLVLDLFGVADWWSTNGGFLAVFL